MEKRHWKHITDNLDKLIETTRCSVMLLSKLQSNGILAEHECVSLITEKDKFQQSQQLYQLIQTRKNGYAVMKQVLLEERQDGAYAILEEGDQILPGSLLRLTYDKQKVLGKGCQNTRVYLGQFGNTPVAVKAINCDYIEKMVAMKEVETYAKISGDTSENIVRYYTAVEDNGFLLIALELCDCNLAENIKANKIQIPVTDIFRQTINGLHFLHNYDKGIIHLDLKPENILLKMKPKGGATVKITDFGIAKQITEDDKTALTLHTSSGLGTYGWMAPEIQAMDGGAERRIVATRAADIFSLGCVFYFAISNGNHPFGDKLRCTGNIADNKYQMNCAQFQGHSFSYYWLIKAMIDFKSENRPTTTHLRSHPAFWSSESTLKFLSEIDYLLGRNISEIHSSFTKYTQSMKIISIVDKYLHSNKWVYILSSDVRNYAISNNLIKSKQAHFHQIIATMSQLYNDYSRLPVNVKDSLGKMPDEFLYYWTSRFPFLVYSLWIHFHEFKNETRLLPYYMLYHHSYAITTAFETHEIEYFDKMARALTSGIDQEYESDKSHNFSKNYRQPIDKEGAGKLVFNYKKDTGNSENDSGMEEWQKQHIQKHFVELVKSTVCNGYLTGRLAASGTLCSSEVKLLELPHITSMEKSKKLYEILQHRVGSYDILVQALNHLLGSGSFGTKVFKGMFADREVAVKVINSDFMDPEVAVREVEFLKRMDHHENILRYFAAETNDELTYIALELCIINLQDEVKLHLLKMNPISILEKCTKGLWYLHRQNIIHRDLKPANILLNYNNGVKISDFGLSKQLPIGRTSMTLHSGVVGTMDWMAPEILRLSIDGTENFQRAKMSTSGDIFSLGCIFDFVLSNGNHPFGRSGFMVQSNIVRNRPQLDSSAIEKEWVNLIGQMISHVPSQRPSAEAVLSSHFLQLTDIASVSHDESPVDFRLDASWNIRSISHVPSSASAISNNETGINSEPHEKVKLGLTKINYEWQNQHLQTSMANLIESTTCSSLLLTALEAKNILNSEDVKTLSSPDLSAIDKSKRLYDILKTQVGSYNARLKSLEITKQSEPLRVLKDYASMFPYYGWFGGRDVAIKALDTELIAPELIINEINSLKKLDNHENIIRYFMAESKDKLVYIALDFCTISLQDEMHHNLLHMSSSNILLECTKGVAHIHKWNIVHADLKPASVLLHLNPENQVRVKISGFGSSIQIPTGTSSIMVDTPALKTSEWMPPEILRHIRSPSESTQRLEMFTTVDIFSLGCIYYFTSANGLHPFGDEPELILDNIYKNNPQLEKAKLNKDWVNIIRGMISHSAKHRPSAQDVLEQL